MQLLLEMKFQSGCDEGNFLSVKIKKKERERNRKVHYIFNLSERLVGFLLILKIKKF